MLYVLDTNTLTNFRFGNAAITKRVLATSPDELAVSVITVEEQLNGWYTQLRQIVRLEQMNNKATSD